MPQFVKESEMDALLAFKLEVNQYKDVLAHTLVETFYCTGMRLAELIGLDEASIDFAHQSLKVLGKRNKERYIPFGAELKESLQYYISIRDQQVQRQSTAFFVDKDGQRLTHNQVRYAVNKCLSTVTTLKKTYTPCVETHLCYSDDEPRSRIGECATTAGTSKSHNNGSVYPYNFRAVEACLYESSSPSLTFKTWR